MEDAKAMKDNKIPLTMQECAKSLIIQAEAMRGDGAEAMRFSQAAVNITNAMINLKMYNMNQEKAYEEGFKAGYMQSVNEPPRHDPIPFPVFNIHDGNSPEDDD